ncbi:MAG: ABC transporter ATP-binding protein [Clostridiales bacterium]|nr:ABC transporter ATP-binding protein [Clostridiales bacterium]
MHIIKRILGYLGRYKGRAIIAVTLLILFAGLNMISPIITKHLIDDVIRGGNRELFPILIIATLIIAAIKGIGLYFRVYFFENVSQHCMYDLRNEMFTHLQDQSFTYFDNNRIGELMSRMTGDLEGIRAFIAGGIATLLENFIYFIGTTIVLFSMNPKLAVVSLAVSPFVAWLAVRFDTRIRPAFGAIREQQAALNTATQENIAGVRVVKAFAREDFEIQKFGKENKLNLEKNVNASRIWAKYFPIMDFTSSLCTVSVLWYGGRMVAGGEISLGTLVAFNSYLWMLINPMRMLGWVINLMEQAVSSGQRVFDVLDTGSIVTDKEAPYDPEEMQGHVEFQDVSFHYGDTRALSNINLRAPAGKTVAIMGTTGAGKTSIINALNRFYDISKGRVLVDGVDVRDWKLNALRENIGIVMQDVFLFSATIEENIMYGNPKATREEVIKAARIADAHNFIVEMPQGYDTIVGERGMGLSGGQKQRIAIARAVIKNPKILIMDDCTSAVDMETEYSIQQALKGIMEGRTTFIIAHRISSVKDADEIIVLDDGQIVERGTHHQLLKQRGEYYEIYSQQYKDFEDFTEDRQVM